MTIGTDHAANCQNASDSDRKCPACGGGEPGTLCRVQASKAEAGPWNGFGEKPHPEDWPKAEAPQERRIAEGRLNKALTSALNGLAEYDPRDDNHWAKTAVAFARGCVRLGDVGAMRRGLKAEAPPEFLGAKLDDLPADWWQDSSLKTWFPFTAQELDALKAQLDTDREVLKETENNISNLAKFAASPITPNYNLPMSGLAIAIRDSLAAALGREILLTQEWDAMKAQNATLTAEVERLRDLILDIADGQEDGIVEARAIRAAREAGKVR